MCVFFLYPVVLTFCGCVPFFCNAAAEEYLNRHVFGIEDDTSLGNMGRVQWTMALSSLAGWVLVGASLIHGIKTSGKVFTRYNDVLYYNQKA